MNPEEEKVKEETSGSGDNKSQKTPKKLKWYQLRNKDIEVLDSILVTGMIASILEIISVNSGSLVNPHFYLLITMVIVSLINLLPSNGKSSHQINLVLVPAILGSLGVIYFMHGFAGLYVFFRSFQMIFGIVTLIYSLLAIFDSNKWKWTSVIILMFLNAGILYGLDVTLPYVI